MVFSALKDRLKTITLKPYTLNDKVLIAKNYFAPMFTEKYQGGEGVDKAIDAVGYQAAAAGSSAAGGEQDEVPNIVLNQLIDVVNPTGALGIPGLYVPTDPGGVDENAKRGALSINFGRLFEKGLRLGTGQCNVKRYNAYLRDMIIAGKAKPSFVVSHSVPLDDAPDAYNRFDKRIDGYTKVILKP